MKRVNVSLDFNVVRGLLSGHGMKPFFLLVVLCFLPFLTFAEEAEIILAIGRTAEWPAPAGVPVSVSNGAVIRTRDLGRKIKITALKIGTSTLRAGDARATVKVLPLPTHRLYERLTAALSGRRGLRIESDGKDLLVRGRLLRWEDWLALAQAAQGHNPSYVFEAELAPEMRARAERYFRDLVKDSHLPQLAFEYTPSAAVSIPLEPADAKDKTVRVLGPFGFKVEASATALALEPLVRVRIVVAEIRKSFRRQFGIDWPSSVEARLLPDHQFPTGGLSLGLNALEENGMGKVLASPTLLCRSGKEAEFLAGGEFPIKTANYKSQDVIWKKHGVLLKIKPQADFSGRMSIAVVTEVSMIDSAHTVDGIPGLLTNRIESHFDLSSSRTIVLSGLIKKEWGDAVSGLPGLGSIPILGRLFSSQDFRDQQSELVVFVTPEVTRPDGEGT